MTINNSKARQEICNHIVSKYNKIEVTAGKCRFNYQCHRNSVSEAKKDNHKKLAMVVYIEDGYAIVHFINYNNKTFTDNTLGEWTSQIDYYFIKWIKSKDMWDVFTVFNAFRGELRKQLSWWVRLTSDYSG